MRAPPLRIPGLAVLAVVAVACGAARPAAVPEPATSTSVITSAGPDTEGPTTTGSVPDGGPVTLAPVSVTPPPASAAWTLGATPLPKGPDGKALVLPTPAALRDRRIATVDRLPPPAADAPYGSAAAPIDAALAARMGNTWQPGCPVPLADLRYITLSFWGFEGRQHTGELVVNASVADSVRKVFGRLFAARFPLEELRIVEPADLSAEPTGDGNTSAAFVCRPVRGSTTTTSAHSSGLAIDINPFQNPYKKGTGVLPELASDYLDRTRFRPGMIRNGDAVTRAFAEVGWTWGGTWSSSKDIMHFSANGR